MAALPISIDQNCNLELRLSPSSSSLFFSDHDSGDHPRLHQFMYGRDDEVNRNSQQQMTIFYNGRVCVAEFTEDQARAILRLATKHVEERSKNPQQKLERSTLPEQCNPKGEAGSGSGLSMKRSLQRFLQKRKNRIQSTSPYNH